MRIKKVVNISSFTFVHFPLTFKEVFAVFHHVLFFFLHASVPASSPCHILEPIAQWGALIADLKEKWAQPAIVCGKPTSLAFQPPALGKNGLIFARPGYDYCL